MPDQTSLLGAVLVDQRAATDVDRTRLQEQALDGRQPRQPARERPVRQLREQRCNLDHVEAASWHERLRINAAVRSVDAECTGDEIDGRMPDITGPDPVRWNVERKEPHEPSEPACEVQDRERSVARFEKRVQDLLCGSVLLQRYAKVLADRPIDLP